MNIICEFTHQDSCGYTKRYNCIGFVDKNGETYAILTENGRSHITELPLNSLELWNY